MKNIILSVGVIISLCAATLLLSSCHTMQGIGEDVQTLGKGISGVAD